MELPTGLTEIKMRFEDPLIDMTGQQQINFKGIDFGGIRIDRVRIYEGIK